MDDDGPKIIPIRKPEIIDEAGGLVDECSAWLCLYGEELDPDAVSRRLGAHPTMAHRKGERKGPKSRPFPKGAWLLKVEGKAPTGPSELLCLLLGRFPLDRAFWTQLRVDYEVRVNVGVHTGGWNRGFDLSSEAMRLVENVGAGLGFDLYFYGDEDMHEVPEP